MVNGNWFMVWGIAVLGWWKCLCGIEKSRVCEMVGWGLVDQCGWGVGSFTIDSAAGGSSILILDVGCSSILRPEKIGTAKDEMLVRR